jgi:MYXO-CTERM domain-containing protein
MVSLFSTQAIAYQQTMTCTESGIYACDPGESPKPVEWPRACVSYRINEVGTDNISDADPGLSRALERAVTDSFDTWNDVDCSRMDLVYGGITEVTAAEFNQRSNASNLNLVVWRDDGWEQVASRQTFALTSVSYNPNTGEIADADIEINAQYYPVSTTDPVENGHIDLRNTLVHEVGHFIGLDHTSVEPATMYASADIGEIDKRTLHEDDIEGICHIYPASPGQMSGCEDPAPENPDPPDNGGCCATTNAPAPGALNWLFAAAGFLALVGVRRRRF